MVDVTRFFEETSDADSAASSNLLCSTGHWPINTSSGFPSAPNLAHPVFISQALALGYAVS